MNELKLGELRGLFKYAKNLFFNYLSQDDVLDHLPDIVPNAINVMCPLLLESGVSNFKFLSRFRAMKLLHVPFECITFDELNAVLENCKIVLAFLRSETVSHSIGVDESEWSLKIGVEKKETTFPSKGKLLEHLDHTGLFRKQLN